MVVSMISDWVFRRVIKLFLKKNLAHLFATEVDVEQLEVQIENGVVEMRDCLLDPSFLNSKLGSRYLYIESVFVQKVKVCIEDLCLDLQGVMMKTKQVKRDSNDVHIYSKFEEQVSADYDRTEDIEKGVHAISECMKYLMDNFSMIARDVIVSFHSEGGDEVKGKVDCFQLKQVDDGQRWFDFSGMNIQVRSKDGDVEAGLDDTSGVLRFPTAVSLQALEETSVSCSLNGPLRIYICPSFLDTYARIFASMTTHGEQTTGNDTSTLHISILRALNLPMLSEDIRITSNAVSHNASSVSDEDLIDSMAELMSTLFMSTSESFYWEDSPTEAHDMGMTCNAHLDIPAAFLTVQQRRSIVLPAQEEHLVLSNEEQLQIALRDIFIDLQTTTIQNIATCCIAQMDMSIIPPGSTNISRKRSLAVFDIFDESLSGKAKDQRSPVSQNSYPVVSLTTLKVRHKYTGTARCIDVQSSDIYAWINEHILTQVLKFFSFPGSQPDPSISLEIALDLSRVWLAIGNFGEDTLSNALVVRADLNKDRSNLNNPVHFFVKDRSQSVLLCSGEIAGFLIDPFAGKKESFKTNGVKLQVIMQEELIADLSSCTKSSLDVSMNPVECLEVFKHSFPMLFAGHSSSERDSRTVHIRIPDLTLTVTDQISSFTWSGTFKIVDGSLKRDHRTVVSAEEIKAVVEVPQPEIISILLQETESRKNTSRAGEIIIGVQRIHISLKIRFTDWMETNLDFVCAKFLHRNECTEVKTEKIDIRFRMDGRLSEVARVCDLDAVIDQKMSCQVESLVLNIDVFVVRTVLTLEKDISLLLINCRRDSERSKPSLGMKEERLFSEPFEYSTNERRLTAESLGLENLIIESYITAKENEISVALEVCVRDLTIWIHDADIDPAEFDASLKTSLRDVVFQCDEASSRGSLTLSSVESWFSSPRQWLREVKCACIRQTTCRPTTMKVEFTSVGSKLDLCLESSKLELVIHQALLLWMRDLPSKFEMEDIFWEDVGNSLQPAEERCTVKCKGFPLDLTFIPSKFDLRNLQHDTMTEMLNIMPKWSAALWMTNANVHNAVDLKSAVRTIVSLWLEDVRDVQLHRIAVEKFPGYSCMRRLRNRVADWIPSHRERSFEDLVTRFLFEVASQIVSHDQP
ncbi:hypothetical protein M9435_004156 [Picochlorum sp. BPE23]|nr:hypothetical protein M9435_004156 [Picochlorum sp. BPE23]